MLGSMSRAGALVAALSGGVGLATGCTTSSPGPAPHGVDASADTGAADTGAADSAAESASPVKTWDYTGIVGTGQSLSVGAEGNPIPIGQKSDDNLKLSLGAATFPPFDPTSAALSLVPLVEPIHAYAQVYPSAYPLNINGETPHTVMADQITSLFKQATGGSDYATVHTVVGESGQPMSVIDKAAVEVDDPDAGTTMGRAYAATLFEAAAIARLASAANKTYGIGAIVLTHGEADASSTTYEKDMLQLWTDYNHDLPAITGQTASIPMLVSQQHSVPSTTGSGSTSTLAQWHAGVANPGKIVCSGPKYQYPYFSDAVHLTAPGYEQLGEKYGEVYFQTVVLGQTWQPLQPTSVDRAGTVVTVHFHVPVLPLVWDDQLPPPHSTAIPQWATSRGFEISTSGGQPLPITSVEIQGDTVQITCGVDVSTLSITVGYAFTAEGTPMPGGTARWGNLRDSDPLVGATTGVPQPNYCVSFLMPVP
jgi:hypothetical protein